MNSTRPKGVHMLILTEKPSVAKDFATALNCQQKPGYFSDGKTEIAYCVGHLFKLHEPEFYDCRFKSWKEIPCIPKQFRYQINESVSKQAKIVLDLLNKHKFDEILIATDADREGEVIARECLVLSGISDFSKIKRFWVSQALTTEVVLQGIKNAKPLSEYNQLSKNGFARQHSDWLVGMNLTRYVSVAANKKLSIGRVKTALLSAIENRCSQIENFQSKKYYEFFGTFGSTQLAPKCKGIYFENEKITGFEDNTKTEKLNACIGNHAKLIDSKIEKKITNPPQLYNLNALQKDAFKYYGYSADKTLKITQSLYEELKCVSYPRTPSRVMGSDNVELCKSVANNLCNYYSDYFDEFRNSMNISLSNKRCFNDDKLEAHHALIPLKFIPASATSEEKNIYNLIICRFFIAFLPEEQYEKQTYILDVNGNNFRITGKKVLNAGWKNDFYLSTIKQRLNEEGNQTVTNCHALEIPAQDNEESLEEEQILENLNWNELKLLNIEAKEKYTKPPKYFNEASILAFMENPTSIDENTSKLIGLGTAATRHTFIPELISNGYIKVEKKNILITELGRVVINSVRNSSIKSLANIEETTRWETYLEENPTGFEEEIKSFIQKAVANNFIIELPTDENQILCPLCSNPIRPGTTKTGIKNWYCTGYKNGCSFKIWEQFNGIKLSQKDVTLLCANKKTPLKNFVSKKTGKEFKARLYLDSNHEIKFDFDK